MWRLTCYANTIELLQSCNKPSVWNRLMTAICIFKQSIITARPGFSTIIINGHPLACLQGKTCNVQDTTHFLQMKFLCLRDLECLFFNILYCNKTKRSVMLDSGTRAETNNYTTVSVGCNCRIWSWSPMSCEKHGPRDSVDKNRGRRPRFLS